MHKKGKKENGDPKFIAQWETPMTKKKFIALLIFDWIGGGIPHMLKIISLTAPKTLTDKIGATLNPLIMGYLIYKGIYWIPAIFLVTMLTSFWTFFRLRIWFEHIGEMETNLIRPNIIEKFFLLPHNTWMHKEHHHNPSLPCWKLSRSGEDEKISLSPFTFLSGHLK